MNSRLKKLIQKIRVFLYFSEFEVRHWKFEFVFEFRTEVRQVRSSKMSKFGCSKFEYFEFVPPLLCIGHWYKKLSFMACFENIICKPLLLQYKTRLYKIVGSKISKFPFGRSSVIKCIKILLVWSLRFKIQVEGIAKFWIHRILTTVKVNQTFWTTSLQFEKFKMEIYKRCTYSTTYIGMHI